MLLSFRVGKGFAKETDQAAALIECSRSDYLRMAVEEKNQRVLEKRMTYLSAKLSDIHLAENEALDDSTGDGLHES